MHDARGIYRWNDYVDQVDRVLANSRSHPITQLRLDVLHILIVIRDGFRIEVRLLHIHQ